MSTHHRSTRRITYRFLAGFAGFGLASTGLDAAIAPQYERVRQFGFVMSVANEAASKLYQHGPIDRIEHMGDGTFRFRAKRCFVPVTLSVVPSSVVPSNEQRPLVGAPIDYRVSLGTVQCD